MSTPYASSSSRKTIPRTIVTATAAVSTTSATNTVITGMTITPSAGTYFVIYSGSMGTGSNDSGELSIFVDGVQQTYTIRDTIIQAGGLLGAVASGEWSSTTTGIFTVTGTQAIDVRFRAVSGSLTANERSLTALRIG